MRGHELESVLGSLEGRTPPEEAVRESDEATALVVSCSMCERAYGGELWPIEPSWHVVGVPTLGNQTWTRSDDGPELVDELAYLTTAAEVATVAVVGHTTCGVLMDAYERSVTPSPDSPTGIEARLHPLVSVVETAFEDGLVDESLPLRTTRSRLVEYNVVRQVRFLDRTLPDPVTTVGYVHDQDGAYRSFPGGRYLVRLDDEAEPGSLRGRLPEDGPEPASLLR